MANNETVSEVHRLASEYREAKAEALEAQRRLDIAIYKAKVAGVSFREISHYSGFSVGHTQKALARQGYQPREQVTE